jgi:phosphinothricin acetyltransferase
VSSAGGFRVRDAVEADLTAICAIYNHEVDHATSTLDHDRWVPAERRDWLAAHAPPRQRVRVVETPEGQVVAWGKLTAWSPKRGYARTTEASLFVDRAWRGHGAGALLLDDLLACAAEGGHRVVLGRIEATNAASLSLFADRGFERVGTMRGVGEKFGRVLDVVMVEKRLDAGPASGPAG